MEERILISFCVIILLSGIVLSGIAINDPEEIYNLGDKVFITATNLKGTEEGNFNIDLVCMNNTVNLLKFSARVFSKEGGQSYSIPYKILSKEDLEIDDIHSIVGSCFIRANLAEDFYETKKFTISDEIYVSGSINKLKYNPGEDITINLNLLKANGNPFDGQYKISNFTSESGEISNGRLEKRINIPTDQAPGDYFLKIEAFNGNLLGEITNNGSISLFLIVNQIPTRIESYISSNEVVPGSEIKISPKIVDQAGGQMDGTITVHITDPDEIKSDYSVRSGESLTVSFEENATKGSYKIYFVSGELTTNADFEMLGLDKISYNLDNNILKIKNIGNIRYFGIVEVTIGETTQDIKVELKVGEEKVYALEAPTGEWNIGLNDGKNSFSGVGLLTGNAVSVNEMGGRTLRSFSLMWIFLIFLAGSFGIVMVGVYSRTKVFSKSSFKDKMHFLSPFKKVKKSDTSVENKDGMVDLTKKNKFDGAESSLVLDGEKVKSVVVSVNAKDKDSFNEDIQKEIIKIISQCCGDKGVVDIKDDFIYLIYSPLVTRSYKNELLAVKSANNLRIKLTEYTRNLSGEFRLGIAIHSGDLVSKKEGRKLKYTSIGNTFSFSNKMAERLEESILLSDSVRRLVMHDLRTTKVDEINGISIYRVDEIKNKAQNQNKLKDLLNRMHTDNI